MESTTALSMPARDPQVDGELAPLARQALRLRLQQADAAGWLRAQQSALLSPDPNTAQQHTNPQPAAAAAGEVAPRGMLDRLRERQPLGAAAFSPQELHLRAPADSAVRGEQPLQDLLAEVRALRVELNQLARVLGFDARTSQRVTYKGVLQQYDMLDSDRRYLRFLEHDAIRSAQTEAQLRRGEAQRLAGRQQELKRAVERAEQRLELVPDRLPPGAREKLLAEMRLASASSALLGTQQLTTLLSGLQFSSAA